jgi:hypothetical protein
VEYQIKNPNLTVCDAMKLADFSLREREDKAKYMMVIRLLNKTKKDDFVTPPAQLSITVSRSSSDLISSVTMSADGGGVTSAPAKKAMRVRSTATDTQMCCKVWNHLCPRTIQKKVKEDEIGCSPLRRGPKGNIPELHFKNLCTAFESFVTINQLNGNMRVCSTKKYGPLIFKVAYGDHEGASRRKFANADGHGGRFHVTGGMHVTSDNVFISMEMSVQNEERGKVEKDRKIRQQLQATEEKALALLEQGKPVNLLSVADLDVLLAWHQAPKTKGAKKADKLQQWMAIRADGDPPSAYKRWTDEEEQRLVALNATNIDISDTQYGREVAMKRRELEAAADHFKIGRRETNCKRNGMRWMWRMRRKP